MKMRAIRAPLREKVFLSGELFGLLGHLGGAFELVPVEGLAVNGALDRFQQDIAKELAIGEALHPDVDQQPGVAFAGGVPTFQQEGKGGCREVDQEEGEKEGQELVEIG